MSRLHQTSSYSMESAGHQCIRRRCDHSGFGLLSKPSGGPDGARGAEGAKHIDTYKPFKYCLISMTSMNIMNSMTCLGNTFDVSFLDVLWECVSYKLETHWAWHRLQMILYSINRYGLTSSNFGSEPYWRWINEPRWKTQTLARFWGDRFPWPDPMLLGGALSA